MHDLFKHVYVRWQQGFHKSLHLKLLLAFRDSVVDAWCRSVGNRHAISMHNTSPRVLTGVPRGLLELLIGLLPEPRCPAAACSLHGGPRGDPRLRPAGAAGPARDAVVAAPNPRECRRLERCGSPGFGSSSSRVLQLEVRHHLGKGRLRDEGKVGGGVPKVLVETGGEGADEKLVADRLAEIMELVG